MIDFCERLLNYALYAVKISLNNVLCKGSLLARKNHKEVLQRTKVIATRSILAIVGIVFGILITAQWKSIPDRITNPIAPYTSLKETRDSLYEEQNQLKEEIKVLQTSIQEKQKSSENIALSKDQLTSIKMEKSRAGLTRLNGPGVIITIDDSTKDNTTEESIVHAADLRDVINLLWSSGAEAISVNGERVVVNTAIDCIVNTILVNNTRIAAPFKIESIGDQNSIISNLNNPLILSDIHKRQQAEGLIFRIEKNNDITMPIFDGSYETKTEGGSN